MDLDALFHGSYINWQVVEQSWAKKTVPSRLMLFAAREYLGSDSEGPSARPPAAERLEPFTALHADAARAFATPPSSATDPESREWGTFLDRALAAELEMISYGERPPTLHEIRNGLTQAAAEAGEHTDLGRWFLDRANNLPGLDLPEDAGYIPY